MLCKHILVLGVFYRVYIKNAFRIGMKSNHKIKLSIFWISVTLQYIVSEKYCKGLAQNPISLLYKAQYPFLLEYICVYVTF